MLTDKKIIEVIKKIQREYYTYKDNGNTFYKQLAQKILNTVDDERDLILDFFLREIRSNENDLCGTALVVIEEMKAVELCPRIVDIYNEVSKYKDDEWKRAVVYVLMQLRYLPPQKLYHNYVLDYMKNNKDSFYLLVQYCNVNPKEALPLLSEELVKNILSEELLLQIPAKIINSLEGINVLIAFLVAYFKNNPNDYLPDLLELVYMKKPKAAIYLKTVIVNYLNSEFAKYSFSESWLNNEINHLNKLSYLPDL